MSKRQVSESETFTLEDGEAAYIFRKDGHELSIPFGDDDDEISPQIVCAVLVATLFSNRPEAEQIRTRLYEMACEVVAEKAEESER